MTPIPPTPQEAKLRAANQLLGLAGGIAMIGAILALVPRTSPLGVITLVAAAVLAVIAWHKRSTADNPTPATLPPGWLDDPETPHRLRYWNGQAWTDKTADKQAPPDDGPLAT